MDWIRIQFIWWNKLVHISSANTSKRPSELFRFKQLIYLDSKDTTPVATIFVITTELKHIGLKCFTSQRRPCTEASPTKLLPPENRLQSIIHQLVQRKCTWNESKITGFWQMAGEIWCQVEARRRQNCLYVGVHAWLLIWMNVNSRHS